MKVDVEIEAARDVEDARGLRRRIGVGIGAAADDVGALLGRPATSSSSVPGSLVRPSCGNTQISRSSAQA